MTGHPALDPDDGTTVDIIAVGSGAAGLMAALATSVRGGSALVVEATDQLGGTTSWSGANLWVPFNRFARAAGHQDDRATAEAYVRRCLGDRADDPRWAVFFDRINDVIGFLETHTRLRFYLTNYPDSFAEWDEGSSARHLGTDLLEKPRLGPLAGRIRHMPGPAVHLRYMDFQTMRVPFLLTRLAKLKLGLKVAWRKFRGRYGMGYAFVLGLVEACLARGVRFALNTRVTGLVRDGPRIVGVVCEREGRQITYRARRGVVLATGGFDHDKALMAEFLPGPIEETMTPPVNRGDHVRLAREVGAQLGAMDEAWFLPGKVLPGAKPYEGTLIGTWLTGDRIWPHLIWVNSRGERFVNESAQNSALAFYARDPATGEQPNLRSWTVFDAQYRARYPVLMTLQPGQPDPDWLIRADTLESLAARIGVPSERLVATVARFNGFARAGKDLDFGRGEGAYDHYFGDHSRPHHTLGTIEKPPFYAWPNAPSSVGTKGGLMTTADGQAISVDGSVIPGLYASGNCSATFNGPITVAAAMTIPPALVMSMAAVEKAFRDNEPDDSAPDTE